MEYCRSKYKSEFKFTYGQMKRKNNNKKKKEN